MKIAVVGTEAMGSVYAALLAEAGNQVWAGSGGLHHFQGFGWRLGSVAPHE